MKTWLVVLFLLARCAAVCVYDEEEATLTCYRQFGIEEVGRFPEARNLALFLEESIFCTFGNREEWRFNVSYLFNRPLQSLTVVDRDRNCQYVFLVLIGS